MRDVCVRVHVVGGRGGEEVGETETHFYIGYGSRKWNFSQ